MSLLSKISGYVQLIPQAQNLLGLRIEFFNFTVSPPVLGAWVGSSIVDARGDYEIFVSDSVSEGAALLVKIYKGTTLIKESVQAAATVINIEVSKSEYDGRIKDDSLIDDTVNFIVVKGTITLGDENILAVPVVTDNVKVSAKKVLFRNRQILASTVIDDYGRYEIKLPYRLLFPETPVPRPSGETLLQKVQSAITNILIDITIGSTIVATSDYFAIEETITEIDLHIDEETAFASFLVQYNYFATGISTLTNLNSSDFYTIITDPPRSEADAIKTSSGMDGTGISNVIQAAKISHDTGIPAEPLYALIRAKESSLEGLVSLEIGEIDAILTLAIRNHIIANKGTISEIVTKLNERKVDLVGIDETDDDDTLDTLLLAILDNDTDVRKFIKLNLEVDNIPVETFWGNVAEEMGEALAARLQSGLQLLAITGMQPEMTKALLTSLDGSPTGPYVAAMTEAGWLTYISQVCTANNKLCVPKSIKGDITDINNVPVKKAYAKQLYDLSTDTFATEVSKQRLQSDENFAACFNDSESIISYLNANPDYDLRTNNAWDTDFGGNEILKKDILPLQNMVRLTNGNPDAVIKMMYQGIRSSSHLVSMSEADFLNRFPDAFRNSDEALQVYNKAVHTDMILKQSYSQLMPGNYVEKATKEWSREVWYDKLPSSPPSPATTPDLETLFGSMDFCACSDCTSMYSPAAYFTDVLNFIKTRLPSSIAYTELTVRRRPDLIHIDLSCKNSNTPLPYIDLVNEQLELIILRDIAVTEPGFFVPGSFQTSGTAKDLEAYPEHIYKDSNGEYKNYPQYIRVYDDRLSKAFYPNSLPFNLALEESRVYFNHLGISRYNLMDQYKPKDYLTLTDPNLLSEYNLQAEWLGLSRIEADIIAKNNPAIIIAGNWQYYGFDTEGTWYNTLCNDLEGLLKRCNIVYKELLQLLVTDFLNKEINGGRPFAIVSKPGKPVDSCQLEDLMLEYRPTSSPPEDGIQQKKDLFDKLHRFIRLQRATGWSIYQLDIVLISLDDPATLPLPDINTTTLINVAKTSKWCTLMSLPPQKVCILWSNISIRNYINFDSDTQDPMPSVYDSFFKNKAVINPSDSNFNDPLNILGTYEDNKGTIIAAVNLSYEDLSLIYSQSGAALTLVMLSQIYRYSIIANLFNYNSVDDYLKEIRLLGISIPSGTIAQVIAQLEFMFTKHDRFKKSGFSIDELTYFFKPSSAINPYPLNEVIQSFYENLRFELRNLYNAAVLANVDLLKKAVEQAIAAQFNIEIPLAAYLSEHVISTQIPPIRLLSEVLIDPAFIESTIDISISSGIPGLVFSDLYAAYYKLDKISLLKLKLKLSTEEIITFQDNYLIFQGFDLNLLVTTNGTSVSSNKTDLLFDLLDWIRFRDIMQLKKDDFITLMKRSIGLEGLSINTLLGYISTVTQWPVNDLLNLASAPYNNLHVTFDPLNPSLNDFKRGDLFLKLNDIMLSSKRTGLKPESTISALKPSINSLISSTIRKAAKAKYSDEAWLKIAKPLQDELRIKQRDALVAYILVNPKLNASNVPLWKDKNSLFAFLLIDTEMQPCMKTSRIKQGISTLQLFLDRIILNIEHVNGGTMLITMSEQLVAQWQSWRKWYRVWEANRKVFLYPENWIEPELRDNKTQLFKDLETQLLQDEVTSERVDAAYRVYLEGLDEVARLEPVSAYHENTDGKDIVHVFSRTDVYPQRYYYRRLEFNEWSPWERIHVDIKSDHVTPIMWNGRLYLFWLTFQAKKLTDAEVLAAQKNARFTTRDEWVDMFINNNQYLDRSSAYTNWNITLNWSSYLDNKWQKSDLSKDVMNIDISKVLLDDDAVKSYANQTYKNTVLQILTKRGEIKIDEFFKNRIYLYAAFEGQSNFGSDGINFNLLFPGGLDENGIGLHAFLWKGDNSRDPYVLRDSDRGHQVIAPLGTRFNKMKFEEDPTQDGKLKLDTYVSKNIGYYTYSKDYYFDKQPRKVRSVSSQVILKSTPFNRFRITARTENKNAHGMNPLEDKFFFEDERHTFYVQKTQLALTATRKQSIAIANRTSVANTIDFNISSYNIKVDPLQIPAASSLYSSTLVDILNIETYRFHTFYHAQSPAFLAALTSGGIKKLLTLPNQSQTDTINFEANYLPTTLVNTNYPRNNVQFDFSEPYSIYNWEIFFHAPMLIAQGLHNNQQFEEAQKWYHYVFNPTSNTNINGDTIETNQRFWKFYPFYKESATPAQTLYQLVMDIHNNVAAAVAQVRKWEDNPFSPHVIARMRILAYMKNVLMKYLDNLIAWGDQLFRRDTIESINEATQMYILAANILGERPKKIPPRVKKKVYTFFQLLQNGPLDALSNAMVAIESFYAPNAAPSGSGFQSNGKGGGREGMNLFTLYFCLPENDKLLGYWDTIADRLFKIRNCMNIDGTVRQLPLYEPPIDPALLVRAKAMGVNINTVLDQINNVNVPLYRFNYVIQKANELVNDVKGLGNALLSALEKKDAESLSLLRSVQEMQLLEKVRIIKELQISEAQAALDALYLTKENTQIRYTYYSSRPFKNANEEEHLNRLNSAMNLGVAQGVLETTAGILSAIPTIHAQLIASGASFGGLQLSNVMRAASAFLGIKVGIDNIKGNMAVTTGGYERRRDDWVFQTETAAKELQQLDQQILGAEIRLDIANRELSNHELQIEHAQSIDDFMRSKYTNAELYTWMTAQISATYFQSYQLAYDMARRAEWCYTYELPLTNMPSTGFIKFGYWDSLRKGLLSGDKLQFDLRKMEATYMQENRREYELTKNFSLAMFSTEALLELKNSGTCEFIIPEAIFDLDYPGHYLRRIKSVSLSIPCIAGPYTTINCELTQLKSKYRKSTSLSPEYAENPDPWTNGGSSYDSLRFTYFDTESAIATSTAQNDSGVFELNFRDERYLPFEGSGAISNWRISFPDENRQFDYESISDVILHIKYTATSKGAGTNFKNAATTHLNQIFSSINNEVLQRYFSIRHEFSNAWYTYNNAFADNPLARILMRMSNVDFPFYCKDKKITVDRFDVQLNPKNILTESYKLKITYFSDEYKTLEINLDANNKYGGFAAIPSNDPFIINGNTKIIQISLEKEDGSDRVNMDHLLEDLYFVASYHLNDLDSTTPDDDQPQADIPYDTMVSWWKADAPQNTTSAGRITNLKDLSGNGINLIPYVAGNGPELLTEGGIQYLNFQDNTLYDNAHANAITGGDSFTFIYIGNSGWGKGITDEWGVHVTDTIFSVCLTWSGWVFYPISNNDSTQNLFFGSLLQTPGYGSSTMKIYNNSGDVINTETVNNGFLRSIGQIGFLMGAAGGTSNYVNGKAYELLVYKRVLSLEERKAILAYLKSKYPFIR
jgi:hypothetical protein